MVFFTSECTINVITTATNLPADLSSLWHIVLICLMPWSVLLISTVGISLLKSKHLWFKCCLIIFLFLYSCLSPTFSESYLSKDLSLWLLFPICLMFTGQLNSAWCHLLHCEKVTKTSKANLFIFTSTN